MFKRCFSISIVDFIYVNVIWGRRKLKGNCCHSDQFKCVIRSLDLRDISLKSDSHLPKKIVNYFIESPLKMMKNAFCFILKALFVLKIFKFLSWFFGHVKKTLGLDNQDYFQNLWLHSLVNKQLQDTYCPISYEGKAARQWNLVN